MLCDKGSIRLAAPCLLTMVTKYLASKGDFLAHKLKGDIVRRSEEDSVVWSCGGGNTLWQLLAHRLAGQGP